MHVVVFLVFVTQGVIVLLCRFLLIELFFHFPITSKDVLVFILKYEVIRVLKEIITVFFDKIQGKELTH